MLARLILPDMLAQWARGVAWHHQKGATEGYSGDRARLEKKKQSFFF
jgi:hypothetical protein